MDTTKKTYSHREAAKLLNISYHTLLRWIVDGKVADVMRERNGYRVFTDADIQRIKSFSETVSLPPVNHYITDEEPCSYSVASFFSGIGGFDLGFQQAGFDVNFQCEVEPFCLDVLQQHWPKVAKWSDITTLDHATVPFSDVWVGGFPCQDLSLARMGKREGLGGSKSKLFYEFARLVRARKPRILVIENVAGLLNSHGGRDFAILLNTLAELGYAVGWRTFNSRYFGVPQSRQRVYIIGCYRDWRGPGTILFESERSQGYIAPGKSNGKKSPSPFQEVVGDISGDGPVIQAIAYCLYATSARHTGTDWSRNYVCYPKAGRIRRLTPLECEGVMAFPENWTKANDLHLDQDQLDSARYHALGNAVTPPVARWLAQRIKRYLQLTNIVKKRDRQTESELLEI